MGKLKNIYARKSTKKGACKLKLATNDPDSWFTKMELIRAKLKLDYGYEIDVEDYIEHILESFPVEYDATIESLHKDLNSFGFLDLDEGKDQVRSRHSRVCKHKGIDPQTVEDEDTEKALTAKYHKKFKGFCNTCGKQGHKSTDCWENEKNKSKRPKNWKSNGNKKNDEESINEEISCKYCKKQGHLVKDCIKLQKKLEKGKKKPIKLQSKQKLC